MAQNAVGLVVPGGPLAGSAFAFRHLRRQGLDAAATTWVLAGANVVSTLAMVALGIVVATGVDVASIVLLVVFGLIAVFLAGVARRPTLIRRPARLVIGAVAAVRRRSADDVDDRVEGVVARLGAVRLSNRDWLFVCLFAAVAVVADCAALICCTRSLIRLPARCASGAVATRLARQCARFRQPTLTRVLLVYLAGQATLSLPLIPGGLGPVEAAMTVTFVAGKIRAVPALSAVLLYRLLSYWSVLLVGMVCWSRLRRQPAPSTT